MIFASYFVTQPSSAIGKFLTNSLLIVQMNLIIRTIFKFGDPSLTDHDVNLTANLITLVLTIMLYPLCMIKSFNRLKVTNGHLYDFSTLPILS